LWDWRREISRQTYPQFFFNKEADLNQYLQDISRETIVQFGAQILHNLPLTVSLDFLLKC
jgi:hypothetical protein